MYKFCQFLERLKLCANITSLKRCCLVALVLTTLLFYTHKLFCTLFFLSFFFLLDVVAI